MGWVHAGGEKEASKGGLVSTGHLCFTRDAQERVCINTLEKKRPISDTRVQGLSPLQI